MPGPPPSLRAILGNTRSADLVASTVSAFVFGLLGGTALAMPARPDPNFLTQVTDSPCKLDTNDPIEKQSYEQEGWGADSSYTRYPGNCRRIHFAYGPIVVKPGQNDVLINPVTIDKPGKDGYITRFKPNLVDQDGKVPPVEQVHLHHGTWLSEPSYGNSAFFAAGEEKTVAPFPKGYGMPVKRTDVWLLLYMVHSAVQNPMTVWITYDVDFVPQANAMALGLKTALPVWMDVRPSAYPVFNVQRKYGDAAGECTWPKQKCADFDPYGKTLVGQGQPGNDVGTDLKLPAAGGGFGADSNFTGGTLIGIGGHLHPGGIRNEIDLVRSGQAQRIYNGIPTYWDHTDQTKGGGPGTSWDFSMRVSGLPKYGVHMRPGDSLRSNAVYDTKTLSSYEDMGITVALMPPDDAHGIPTVKLGSNLEFDNADTALDVYHTITTCAYPCLGATGSAFPLANGTTSLGRSIDLDSSELGYGVPTISGVKNEATWSIPVTPAEGYRPGEVVTYFCRIHPSMRGAFKVVE